MRLLSSFPAVWRACLGVISLAIIVSITFGALAHEGHDHGEADKPVAPSSAYPRVVARSELYEIVGVLKGRELSVYLDNYRTNEPVTQAKVEVTFGDGEAQAASETAPGIYLAAAPEQLKPGNIEVIFSISGGKGDDLLVDSLAILAPPATSQTTFTPTRLLLPISVFAFLCLGLAGALAYRRRGYAAVTSMLVSLAAGALVVSSAARGNVQQATLPSAALSDAPRRLPDGTAFVAKSTQRLLDVRLALAEQQSIQPASVLTGRVIGDPDRRSIVQSVYGGRVLANEGRTIPRIGQSVKTGDVLLELEPVIPLADRTTIQEKIGEIEQLIAVAESKLTRMRPLGRDGILPSGQISDLESELAGLKARRTVSQQTRSNLETLRAPTDGVVISAKVVAGQVIQPQDIIFEIADPARLWVEALSYGEFRENKGMSAMAARSNGQSFQLSYLGVSRALRQHATVVQFAVTAPPEDLNIGQLVTVHVQTGEPVSGFILPRDAVVRSSNGESIVWIQKSAEAFEALPVRVLPVDATRVVAAAGLKGGERLIVRGADLVNQVR